MDKNDIAKTCIFTGKCLAPDTSEEHVLQNFTGARWTSANISCNEVQDKFGEGCDCMLAKNFSFVRQLIGSTGDRRSSLRSVEMTSERGHKFWLKNGEFTLSKPIVGELHDQMISACVGRKEDIGWARHLVEQKLPQNCRIQHFETQVVQADLSQEGFISARLTFSLEGLKGIVKSCFNLLGVQNHGIAVGECFADLRNLLVNDCGETDDFCRICSSSKSPSLPKWGDFDHVLLVYSEGNGVSGFAQFYGHFLFSMRLSPSYVGESFSYGYHVDSLREHNPAEEREVTYSISDLPKFEEQPSPQAAQALYAALQNSYDEFMESCLRHGLITPVFAQN